jgi:flagellum-specific peptidoglycan hydrolase FlgJ
MQFLIRSANPAASSLGRCAAILSFVLATAGTVAAAETVRRCEAEDGKVTYSNSPCPEGTKTTRQVNTTPPVTIDEQKAAKDRAKRDAADAKDAERARDKEQEKEQAKAERAAAEQNKAQAKERERCDRARRELERARSARASLLQQRAATIDEMQKADREISKREGEAAKSCPG